MRVRGVCECALKLPRVWEGCAAIILHITGCQPDSGKPTVRDERGACGNVGYGGTRHPPRLSKERVLETLHLRSYAPYFYPTALVGFQGRGCAEGVQPDFCHALLLAALIFQ